MLITHFGHPHNGVVDICSAEYRSGYRGPSTLRFFASEEAASLRMTRSPEV
jgi:hypothetical protein